MGLVRFHRKRAGQDGKSWFGKLFTVAFWPTLASLIISGVILVQRPLIERMITGLIYDEQNSSFKTDQVALILSAADQRYFSFKLSESQKSISETYRLGSMDLVFSNYQTEKSGWNTFGVTNTFVRLSQTTPIYILGHAFLN